MSQKEVRYQLAKVRHHYLWLRGIEILLVSLAAALLSFFLLKFFSVPFLSTTIIAFLLGSITAVLRCYYTHIFRIKRIDMARYLNSRYPELEQSADLLVIEDEKLSSLQQLQKIKTVERFEKLYPSIKLPHHIGGAAVVFSLSIIISAMLTSFSQKKIDIETTHNTEPKFSDVAKRNLPVSIKRCRVSISPPPYTGLRSETSEDLNIHIPEGSTVQWELTFESEVLNPRIIFSATDSIFLSAAGPDFKVTRKFTASGFYQLTWQNADAVMQRSDYYKITVMQDHAPTIALENQNQFVELAPSNDVKVQVAASLSDDYGLTRAHIIATVSKGSGEAIKFREEKLTFDAPRKISGKKSRATLLLDLVKLGLQPGDELYYYIEAIDNKIPTPNRSRTETYFISLADTASQITSVDGSLGVDLMPTYFRSQRQIIIDSEKLLKGKNRITTPAFNSRSNELAHDQKVLRLKYGEFLGEEFESNIGPSPAENTLENDDEPLVEKFGHAHDGENEHNLVDDRNHSHEHAASTPIQKDDPLKDFVHAHDGTEEATFFIRSIKAKLKAAITIMWDAELYLRLNQPEKSLPYQYKALNLLKEISQDSRIYVHRTGFDPPPLKEEKRLTGDLSEITSAVATVQTDSTKEFPAIRACIPVIENLLLNNSTEISPATKDLLAAAGRELAGLARTQPGGYLETLSALQRITQQESNQVEIRKILQDIRTSFWNVLPSKVKSPQAQSGVVHDLDRQFLNSLEVPKPIH